MKKTILPFLLLILVGCQQPDQWQVLFNGEDLSGWHIYGGSDNPNGWTVQKGLLIYDPSLRTSPENANLVTDQPYETLNFLWNGPFQSMVIPDFSGELLNPLILNTLMRPVQKYRSSMTIGRLMSTKEEIFNEQVASLTSYLLLKL